MKNCTMILMICATGALRGGRWIHGILALYGCVYSSLGVCKSGLLLQELITLYIIVLINRDQCLTHSFPINLILPCYCRCSFNYLNLWIASCVNVGSSSKKGQVLAQRVTLNATSPIPHLRASIVRYYQILEASPTLRHVVHQ